VIRRTLALAGAAALAVAASGLAGPAAADSGPGITTHDVLQITELAAGLSADSTLHNLDGGFIELFNPANPITEPFDTVDISGFTVSVCTNDDEFANIVTIPSNTVLSPGQHYLIADASYDGIESPDPDAFFQQVAQEGVSLTSAGGGVLLKDGNTVIDHIQWGEPDEGSLECETFNEAGEVPTPDESINRDSPWELQSPSPTPMD
jgi:hypothetical protein